MTFKLRLSLVLFLLTFLSIGGFADLPTPAYGDAAYVTWSAVSSSTGAYGNGIDTVSFRNNAIYMVGNYQFVAYYNNDSTPHVTLARRDINTNTWTNISTAYTADTVTDDHDVISFGIDVNGTMHMSWGMHNGSSLHYATSTASVLGSSFSPTFSTTTITIPNTASEYGNSTTYPEFYNLSNGGLMFTYRTGASGDGDAMYSLYNPTTHTWSSSPTKLIDGTTGSYNSNAYTNNLVFDSQGRIQMSWVWRETSDFQSNHDIMYAYATNETLTTWKQMSGSTQTVPITQGNDAVIKSISQGSSLINQCSMTVDANNNPIIATYWAPTTSTRQYMLEYYNGTNWQTSQISNRTVSDAKITNNDALRIREVGRPIVLVDADGRIVVVTRSNDQNNVVTAYYSTNKTTWNLVNLTTVDSGRYEPIYDEVRWKRDNILSLFYEPAFADSSGNRTTQSQNGVQISVLEWNSLRYLRNNIVVDWAGGNASGATNWGLTANWTNNALPPDGKWTSVRFGNESSANNVVDMVSAGRTVGNITFTASTSTTIQSTGGYSLTLDNSGSDSTIALAGTHTIAVPVLMDNDVNVSGTGTLNLSGGISGNYALDVLSGNVTAKSVAVSTLTIGSGVTFTIQAIAGGPLSGNLTPVPEPSALVLLAVGALFAAGYARLRRP
ncbi:MAG: BNR-4 repeat-containing protein [Thermoguttaceae bacterium]